MTVSPCFRSILRPSAVFHPACLFIRPSLPFCPYANFFIRLTSVFLIPYFLLSSSGVATSSSALWLSFLLTFSLVFLYFFFSATPPVQPSVFLCLTLSILHLFFLLFLLPTLDSFFICITLRSFFPFSICHFLNTYYRLFSFSLPTLIICLSVFLSFDSSTFSPVFSLVFVFKQVFVRFFL